MDIDIMSIILPYVESYKTTLIEFAKSRFLVAAQEFGMNEKETAELSAIADSINVEIVSGGSSIDFNITFGTSPYLDIIQNGMPAPLSGGNGGIATNPDGTSYVSDVPIPFQGEPIESFSKTGQDVIGEIGTMAVNIGRDIVSDAANAANTEIAQAVVVYMQPHLLNLAGGGS